MPSHLSVDMVSAVSEKRLRAMAAAARLQAVRLQRQQQAFQSLWEVRQCGRRVWPLEMSVAIGSLR